MAKPKPRWDTVIAGLYNVVTDPRELTDLQATMPDKVKEIYARFVFWNATTVVSIHNRTRDPGSDHWANKTNCWSPWEGKDSAAKEEL